MFTATIPIHCIAEADNFIVMLFGNKTPSAKALEGGSRGYLVKLRMFFPTSQTKEDHEKKRRAE